MNRMTSLAAAAAALALFAGPAFPHGSGEHPKDAAATAKAEQQDWGIAGEPREARRTMEIAMSDAMRFTPASIDIKEGETVRFVVRNRGQVMHEMVIGTKEALDRHAALMQKFPNMEHDEPHMAHVGPGKKGELVWKFNRAGEFAFACLVPGHFQAGMVGSIRVSK